MQTEKVRLTDAAWWRKVLAKTAPLARGTLMVSALAANGITFAETRPTIESAYELVGEMVLDNSDPRGELDAAQRSATRWLQIVVYNESDMSVVDQIDLCDRNVSTDAPLLEPLPE